MDYPTRMTNIFEFLDWVLKKKGKEPIDENTITSFMFNRWLSMADIDVAKIVNITQNRWGRGKFDDDFLSIAKFYHIVLPKTITRISYIKKPTKTLDKDQDDKVISENLEFSIREKRNYDKLLKELSI